MPTSPKRPHDVLGAATPIPCARIQPSAAEKTRRSDRDVAAARRARAQRVHDHTGAVRLPTRHRERRVGGDLGGQSAEARDDEQAPERGRVRASCRCPSAGPAPTASCNGVADAWTGAGGRFRRTVSGAPRSARRDRSRRRRSAASASGRRRPRHSHSHVRRAAAEERPRTRRSPQSRDNRGCAR